MQGESVQGSAPAHTRTHTHIARHRQLTKRAVLRGHVQVSQKDLPKLARIAREVSGGTGPLGSTMAQRGHPTGSHHKPL